MKTTVVWLTGLAAVVGWGLYFRCRAQSRESETQLKAARAEVMTLRAAAWTRAGKSGGDHGQAEGSESNFGGGGNAGKEEQFGRMATAWFTRLASPEYVKLRNSQLRLEAELENGGLLKRLQLSPEKAERVRKLLADRLAAGQDTLLAALQDGVSPLQNPDDYSRRMVGAFNGIDQDLRETLGEDNFKKYQEYSNSTNQQANLMQFDSVFARSGEPMTAEQHEKMAVLMTDLRRVSANGGSNARDREETLVEMSKSFLSVSQHETLQRYYEKRKLDRDLNAMVLGRSAKVFSTVPR